MSDLPTFEPWPKIPRLRRTVIVTEKIDGTNAHVHVLEDGRVLAASRNRYLVDGQENYGFAAWVKQNEQALAELLGYGRHYGEWWGAGIQRGYGLRERRFSLFNTSRWKSEDPLGKLHDCGVYVVPTLAISEDHEEINRCLRDLSGGGSAAAPGFMSPEGVVVYHTASQHLYKVLIENDDVPKGNGLKE